MADARQNYSYLKKIAAQKAGGNSAKAKNLTLRYRAKVSARNNAAGDTSSASSNPVTGAPAGGQFGSQYNTGKLDQSTIRQGLKKYAGVSPRARKRTLAAYRSLSAS